MARPKAQKKVLDPHTAQRHYVRVVAFVTMGVSLGILLILHAYPYLEVRQIVERDGNVTPEFDQATFKILRSGRSTTYPHQQAT